MSQAVCTAGWKLSRNGIPHWEWRLYPGTVEVDLFATEENTHCPLFFSLSHSRLGGDRLTMPWPNACLYAFPPIEDFATSATQNQRGESVGVVNRPILAQQTVVARYGTPTPNGGNFMCGWCAGTTKPGLIVPPGDGHNHGGASPFYEMFVCSQIGSLYEMVRIEWPQPGEVSQVRHSRVLATAIGWFMVYVATISAFHATVYGCSVGKHNLVIRFLKGARWLRPSRPPTVPPWDLTVVLGALAQPTFQMLQSVGLRELSFKAILLLAMASVKSIGDLHALSMNADCMQFGQSDCNVTLKP
ncbi:Protein transport protein SEC24 [Labeo rohita]|uniref:Protein transport protein SEC24 n=1 Tax=Labeo rohita TaxID=84645 RepID=A0ABQ8M061_LABRO|nr:Protein transport protein SEC24 [Labeo rohita]